MIYFTKLLLTVILLGCISLSYAQAPANDNCSNATTLTIDAPWICDQKLDNATVTGSECITGIPFATSTKESIWYRFTSNNDSLVWNTNLYSGSGRVNINVYGPFNSGDGCASTFDCSQAIFQDNITTSNKGRYNLLTGLIPGKDYLVQIVGGTTSSGGLQGQTFCFGVYTPEKNNQPADATLIESCGDAYAGSTAHGYYPTGDPAGHDANYTTTGRNIDGNATTTAPGQSTGQDVKYSVNNDSWFSFCSQVDGGEWQIGLTVGNCLFDNPVPGGVQMTLLTGTPNNLTWVMSSGTGDDARVLEGGSWQSSTFTLNNGECAYLEVDGYQGDGCDYNFVLTNITGGCQVLPIKLLYFNGAYVPQKRANVLYWSTATESNNNYFYIERSTDLQNWEKICEVQGAGNSVGARNYQLEDKNFTPKINYYRLSQVDFNGSTETFKSISIDNSNFVQKKLVKTINLLGQEVKNDTKGPVILIYDDGSTEKISR